MGEVTMNFAIGQYDYETKAAIHGRTGDGDDSGNGPAALRTSRSA